MDSEREREWRTSGSDGDAPEFVAAPMPPRSPADLVREPIGYWTGEAHRQIGAALRAAIGGVGLSQPQWWMLNHLDSADGYPRSALLARLEPFNAQQERRDLAVDLDDLLGRGLVVETSDGAMALTGDGDQLLQAARRTMSGAHLAMTAGVSDDAYGVAIQVLMQIVANLGADPDG